MTEPLPFGGLIERERVLEEMRQQLEEIKRRYGIAQWLQVAGAIPVDF